MSSTENSATIAEWGDETLGSVTDLRALVDRAEREMAELRQAIVQELSPEQIGLEAADVAILLHRLAGLLEMDLNQLVHRKMAVNRARSWVRSGDGTGSHL